LNKQLKAVVFMPTSASDASAALITPTRPHWPAVAAAWLLLLLTGAVHCAFNPDATFALIYLVPVLVITWNSGRRAGLAACALASALTAAAGLAGRVPVSIVAWNAIAYFALCFAFCFMVDLVRASGLPQRALRAVARVMAFSIALAAVAALSGIVMEHANYGGLGASPSLAIDAPERAGGGLELALLQARLSRCVETSRPLLLGSRDPNGPSCVPTILTGDIRGKIPPYLADLDGGPGTKVSVLAFFDRAAVKSPAEDFAWHQRRLRMFLENQRVENAPALARCAELSSITRAFFEQTLRWNAVPANIAPLSVPGDQTWPSYCMRALSSAVSSRDLTATRRWAGELASAALALEDLHRWLGFLVENHLTALAFQARCQSLFDEPFAGAYEPTSTLSQFPAGVVTLNNVSNYFEVERQAERLFSLPADRVALIDSMGSVPSDALWLSPDARRTFLELGEVLSPANRATWAQAAQTPFEHSYLVNMLYRAGRADQTAQLKTVLKRFDANYPHASVPQLMGVLVYRGHSFAGLEWGDRYQPQLIEAAAQTTGSPREVLLAAARWTNRFYEPTQYGLTFTLRDAIAERRLDCVRSTDMIAAIYRNAGRTALGHVWWSAGSASHSVAALLESDKDRKPQTSMVDGLVPGAALEEWPSAYFRGHDWPAGMKSNPQPYSAELYVRGIDNYVWAEGYIIRGPGAGTLSKAMIPYLTARAESATSSVYAGPYPSAHERGANAP
jgi:hypothetical protein